MASRVGASLVEAAGIGGEMTVRTEVRSMLEDQDLNCVMQAKASARPCSLGPIHAGNVGIYG